jgi:hypothetical protein
MSQKMISRRGALSLLGLAAALGFAAPTTVLTMSDAEAQAQPTAPAPQAQPTAPTPNAPAMSGMERRQQRRAARQWGKLWVERAKNFRGTLAVRSQIRLAAAMECN